MAALGGANASSPWTEVETFVDFLIDMDIVIVKEDLEPGEDPRQALWLISSIAFVGLIFYFLFMKTVSNSDMDSVFTNLYRLQATEALITVLSQTGAVLVTATSIVEGPQKSSVCRGLLTTVIAFYLSFFFTLMMIAFTRCMYVIFPLYIHHLHPAVLQASIAVGWAVFAIFCAVVVYKQEIWSLFLLYLCIGIYGTPLLTGNMITTLTFLVIGITLLLYVFILAMQYKSKVPHRRRIMQVSPASLPEESPRGRRREELENTRVPGAVLAPWPPPLPSVAFPRASEPPSGGRAPR